MVSLYPPDEDTLLVRPPALALISGKGGVGRSSLALNLAIALGVMQEQVLLVDADPTPGHLALLAGV
ncbi:MAG: P-loop NTPase, partial [Gemmatimonadetes bacterium]|nr:P-loop NTPase [Gemmatimonadota bacterium]